MICALRRDRQRKERVKEREKRKNDVRREVQIGVREKMDGWMDRLCLFD